MEQFCQTRLVLDSGATTCRYILYDSPEVPLLSGSLKGVNYTEEGFSGLKRLFNELDGVLRAGGFSPPGILGAAFAGAGREDVAVRLRIDAEEALPDSWDCQNLYFFHDGEAALWAALGAKPGIVISSGSGSIALGRDQQDHILRSGGWGRLIGDEGSAYWIGSRAAAAVMRSYDGRQEPTLLEPLMLKELQLNNTYELVNWIHTIGLKKEKIAELALIVEEASIQRDGAAIKILEEAGTELASLVLALLTRGDFQDSPLIGITGSVLHRNRTVRMIFEAAIKKFWPQAEFLPSHRDNLQGTVAYTEALIRRG